MSRKRITRTDSYFTLNFEARTPRYYLYVNENLEDGIMKIWLPKKGRKTPAESIRITISEKVEEKEDGL